MENFKTNFPFPGMTQGTVPEGQQRTIVTGHCSQLSSAGLYWFHSIRSPVGHVSSLAFSPTSSTSLSLLGQVTFIFTSHFLVHLPQLWRVTSSTGPWSPSLTPKDSPLYSTIAWATVCLWFEQICLCYVVQLCTGDCCHHSWHWSGPL